MARAQHVLQSGTFVADVLLCTSGEAPDFGTDGEIPEGYDGDRCHPSALAECRVDDGCVIVPGGVRYRVVGTPARGELRPEASAALARLERLGATVVEYGEVAAALKRLGCAPDFACDDCDVRWIHRRIDEDDVYFVAVPNKEQKKVVCSFRTAGRTPELWDAMDGSASKTVFNVRNGRTEITLDCPPAHSVFVVFRSSKEGTVPKTSSSKEGTVPRTMPAVGTWNVTFREPMATNDIAAAKYTKLDSWTNSDNPDIRYFSGTARYLIKFSISGGGACPKGNGDCPQRERVFLDLGRVKNIAEVTVNGKAYPALWKPPFVMDITDAVERDVTVDLEVKVTNYWPNRLIGDETLCAPDAEYNDTSRYPPLTVKEWPEWLQAGKPSPTGRHAFATCHLWTASDALLPSGLLGPVKFVVEKPVR